MEYGCRGIQLKLMVGNNSRRLPSLVLLPSNLQHMVASRTSEYQILIGDLWLRLLRKLDSENVALNSVTSESLNSFKK